MMICPETFYETNLKGKSPEQILTVIRRLKREIGRLKNVMEHPDYAQSPRICPGEDVRIWSLRMYLERAIVALEETGERYVPSAAEEKAAAFDARIPNIHQVVFSIGGHFTGYETKTFTIKGEQVHTYVEHTFYLKPSNFDDSQIQPLDKEEFLEQLQSLHIGEWRRTYDLKRFGCVTCDGIQWRLEIHYRDSHQSIRICGDNGYPYNFSRLLELFEIEISI